jgi:hypothetical protein
VEDNFERGQGPARTVIPQEEEKEAEEEDWNFVIVYHMNHAGKKYVHPEYSLMNERLAATQIFYSHE